jgi:hypothetical protein
MSPDRERAPDVDTPALVSDNQHGRSASLSYRQRQNRGLLLGFGSCITSGAQRRDVAGGVLTKGGGSPEVKRSRTVAGWGVQIRGGGLRGAVESKGFIDFRNLKSEL